MIRTETLTVACTPHDLGSKFGRRTRRRRQTFIIAVPRRMGNPDLVRCSTCVCFSVSSVPLCFQPLGIQELKTQRHRGHRESRSRQTIARFAGSETWANTNVETHNRARAHRVNHGEERHNRCTADSLLHRTSLC